MAARKHQGALTASAPVYLVKLYLVADSPLPITLCSMFQHKSCFIHLRGTFRRSMS